MNHRKKSTDPVLIRIMELLKEQNKTQKELTDYLNLHPNTFNNWKYANTQSYLKRLDDISDFLNVTPGYLIKGNTVGADEEGLTPLEIKLTKKIKTLTIDQQKALLNLIDKFA